MEGFVGDERSIELDSLLNGQPGFFLRRKGVISGVGLGYKIFEDEFCVFIIICEWFNLPAASPFLVGHTLIFFPRVHVNSPPSLWIVPAACTPGSWASAGVIPATGWLWLHAEKWTGAAQRLVLKRGKVAWHMIPAFLDGRSDPDRSANLDGFFLARRAVGPRVSSCSSPASLPVYTCPSSAALLSHSAAFILEWACLILTAGTRVISASAPSNGFWPVRGSPRSLSIRRTQILESLIGLYTAP